MYELVVLRDIGGNCKWKGAISGVFFTLFKLFIRII